MLFKKKPQLKSHFQQALPCNLPTSHISESYCQIHAHSVDPAQDSDTDTDAFQSDFVNESEASQKQILDVRGFC